MKNYIVKGLKYTKFSIRSRGVKYFCGEVFYHFLSKALKKCLYPTLEDFYGSGFEVKFNDRDVFQILENRIQNKNGPSEVDQFESEMSPYMPTCRIDSPIPSMEWTLNLQSFLYMLVRLTTPDTVIETGVANGFQPFLY